MDSLADNYLLCISKSIDNYCQVIFSGNPYIDRNRLIDIIYDYLNEVFLLKKEIKKINYNQTLKVVLSPYANSLLNIMTEYGIVDRIKLKDKNIKKSYIFVVDTIIFFINLEFYVYKKEVYSYDQAYSSVIKNNKFIDKVNLKLLLNNNKKELVRIFNKNRKTFQTLDKLNLDQSFGTIDFKLGKDIIYHKMNYNNDSLINYNYNEFKYVQHDYLTDIYFNCLETLTISIIKEMILGKNYKHFIYIPEYILKKKSNYKRLQNILNIYSISQSICLVLESNYYLKYKEIIYNLGNDYNLAIRLDCELDDNIDLKDTIYVIIDNIFGYDLTKILLKIDTNMKLLFNISISNEIKEKLSGYEYVVCKRVKYE